MKPSFALNLTDDGVTLLHRTARGWLDVGFAAFSDPDLPAALDYLRSTALGLSPKGLTTKLVIPNGQILYTDVDLHGVAKADHPAAIEAALAGRTPYDVADLAFDWRLDGDTAHVAVVARETLAEAEGFATQHRFNPLSFVAIPDLTADVVFEGEPFFGPSSMAPDLLARNQTLQKDDAAITIITREMRHEAPVADAAKDNDDTAGPEAAQSGRTGAEDLETSADLVMPVTAETEAGVAKAGDPEPEAPQPEAPQPEDPQPEDPQPEAPQPEDPQPEDPQPFEAPPEQPRPAEPEPEPAPMEVPQDAPDLSAPSPRYDLFAALDEPKPEAAAKDTIAKALPAEDTAADVLSTEAPRPKPPVSSEMVFDADEAPMAVDVPGDDDGTYDPPARPMDNRRAAGDDAAPPVTDVEADLPPPLSTAALLAFASRRAAEVSGDVPAMARGAGVADAGLRGNAGLPNGAPPLRPVPSPAGSSAGANAGAGAGVAARPAAPRPTVDRPAGARPAPKFSYDDPVPPPPRMPGDPVGQQGSVMGKASKGLRSLGAMVSNAPGLAAKGKKKPNTAPNTAQNTAPSVTVGQPSHSGSTGMAMPTTALAIDAPQNAPLRATGATVTPISRGAAVHGASALVKPDALAKGLSARSVPQRGKPRFLGLILTGILLLILAIVAGWSSYYLTQRDQPDATAVAASDAQAISDEMQDDLAATPDGMTVDEALPGDQPTDRTLAEVTAPDAITPDLPAAEPEQAAAVEPAPQTGVESDTAVSSGPTPATQDEIFLAGMDTPPALSDPLVLTAPAARGDAAPATQLPPPPFGTVYQFDADGLIVPMPDGIVTPAGVLLIAGAPPRLPPVRPAAVETAAAAAAPPAQTTTPEAPEAAADATLTPAMTFAADPALSDARPRVRPAGLAPDPAATETDDASLAPEGDSRVASLRPRARPSAILAAGEAARIASQAASTAAQTASLVAQAAAEAAIVEASANISPQAVAVSRVPAPRPRNLSRAVEAAVAAATRQPDTRAAAASTAAPAPKLEPHEEEDQEPEVASAAPRIPTKANVAKQATFVNAINLSKMNLIGVYGSQSNRSALIRQSNGRYKKVKVGDRIDGGRIQAITANEVRYQKGGRLIALAMPKG